MLHIFDDSDLPFATHAMLQANTVEFAYQSCGQGQAYRVCIIGRMPQISGQHVGTLEKEIFEGLVCRITGNAMDTSEVSIYHSLKSAMN